MQALCKIVRYFSSPPSCSFTFFQPLVPSPSSDTLASFVAPLSLYINFSPSHLTHSLDSLTSLYSYTECSAVCAIKYPLASSSPVLQTGRYYTGDDGRLCFKLDLHRLHCYRHFTSHPDYLHQHRTHATLKQVSDIIDLIKDDADGLGSMLHVMNVTLSLSSIVDIFWILARERVSALQFFYWLTASHPEIRCHPEICSLITDNCGRLGNYKAMVCILTDFNLKRLHLGQKAFGFLQDSSLGEDSIMESLCKTIDVLNEVGGSCRTSGFHSLIEIFSGLGSFATAEFVIVAAGRKAKYYTILMRELCRRSDDERAKNLLNVMKQSGCDLSRTTYNMVVSCLCKTGKFAEACQMLEVMEEDCILPDASTFDILINFLCKRDQSDLALQFLDKMNLKGIEPRISTHAAIIKAYFKSQKYKEAQEFVVDSAVKQRYSSNANYNLLATLHLKNGNVLLAQKILYDMMDKGLKPNFSVYRKTMKQLLNENMKVLSLKLKSRCQVLLKNER